MHTAIIAKQTFKHSMTVFHSLTIGYFEHSLNMFKRLKNTMWVGGVWGLGLEGHGIVSWLYLRVLR